MTSHLARGLSQEDIDAAQQLIEHSQSVPPQQLSPDEYRAANVNAFDAQASLAENGDISNGDLQPQEHHDLDDSMAAFPQPYATPPGAQFGSPGPGSAVTGGQMCRYV